MRTLFWGWLLCLVWYGSGFASSARMRLEELLAEQAWREAAVGVEVISVADGRRLYSHRAEELFIPASNMKLLTTAAALVRLGGGYTFRTEIYGDSPLAEGRLAGNIYIKGYGDPALVYEELWKLARYLAGLGLREVTGDVVADESFFDKVRYGRGWPKRNKDRWYEAPVGALSFNFNTLEINVAPGTEVGQPPVVWLNPPLDSFVVVNQAQTAASGGRLEVELAEGRLLIRGSISRKARPKTFWRAVSQPAEYTAQAFAYYLKLAGIKLRGRVRRGMVPPSARLIHTHKSKPLALIVRGLNKFSNNFTAEQLLKTLGAEAYGPPGTADKGLRAVREFLRDIGVATERLVLVDGSGFSYDNRLSPRAIVQVLTYMYREFPVAAEYLASLSVAGVDGTLKRRMPEIKGWVRAKTGRIRKAVALSGYLATRSRQVLAFSILVNNFTTSIEKIQQLQDRLCRILIEEF